MKTKKQPKSVSEGIRVFVYGTLKATHPNYDLLSPGKFKDNEYIGRCWIKGPYKMRDLTWFPGVQYTLDPSDVQKIYGEVYRIDYETLQRLDILEGNGNFFTRTQVETPWKKAWIYMIPQASCSDRPVVPEGVWQPTATELQFVQSNDEFIAAHAF